MTNSGESFAELLNKFIYARKNRNVNGNWLADRIGRSRSTVGDWLNRDRLPRNSSDVIRIAEVLELTPHETRQLLNAAGYEEHPLPDSFLNPELHSIKAEQLQPVPHTLTQLPLDDVVLPGGNLADGSSIMPYGINPHFVGREDMLHELAVRLKGGDGSSSAMIVAVITGTGGVGKTQLAIEFVHRYGPYFEGGVYWINMAEPASVPTAIIESGQHMPGLPADFLQWNKEKWAEKVSAIRSLWQRPIPRLLIFDNCEEPKLLDKWRPKTGGSRVLLTSRRSNWDGVLGVQPILMTGFERFQSVALLRHFCSYLKEGDPDLDEIAKEVGDLPLALHLAGCYLKRYSHIMSPDAYLSQLREVNPLQHPSLQNQQDASISPTNHDLNVFRTFQISYNQLDANDVTDKLALQLLARSAHFAPSESILYALLVATIHTKNVVSLQIEDALTRLKVLGLLHEEANEALVLHPLLAQFVHTASQELSLKRDAQKDVESVIALITNKFNESGHYQHILPWQSHLRYITDLALRRQDIQAVKLSNGLGQHYYQLGDFSSARHYLEQASAINRRMLNEEHSELSASIQNLEILKEKIDETDTDKPYLEQAFLLILEKTIGFLYKVHDQKIVNKKEYLEVATEYHNLGVLLMDMGVLKFAGPMLEQSLTMRQKALGKEHLDTIPSLKYLSILMRDLGKLGTAISYLKEALIIRQKMLGEEHLDTATSLNDYGSLLIEMGEWSAARPYLEQALIIRQKIGGEEHLDTATSFNDFGSLLIEMGEWSAARPYLEQALAIRQEVLGKKHRHTVTSLRNVGVLMQCLGEWNTAKAYLDQALSINQKMLNERHLDIAQSLSAFGLLLMEMGELSSAEAYLTQAHAIYEENLGKKHPKSILSGSNYGMLKRETNDLDSAEISLRKAEWLCLLKLGEKHPYTAICFNNLGMLLQDRDELELAKSYLGQALTIRQKVLGDSHPNTAQSFHNLGVLLLQTNEHSTAKSYLEQALSIYRRVLGNWHPDTALALTSLGLLLHKADELTNALAHQQQALAIFSKKCGLAHQRTQLAQQRLDAVQKDINTPY